MALQFNAGRKIVRTYAASGLNTTNTAINTTTPTTLDTLTVPERLGANGYLFFSTQLKSNSATVSVAASMTSESANTSDSIYRFFNVANEVLSSHGVTTFAGDVRQETYSLQGRVVTTAAIGYYANRSIVFLESTSNDFDATDLNETTVTNTTTTILNVTGLLPSTRYIYAAGATAQTSALNVGTSQLVQVDGYNANRNFGLANHRFVNANDTPSYAHVGVYDVGLTGGGVANTRYAVSTTGTIKTKMSGLTVMRAENFENVYFKNQTGNTSYADTQSTTTSVTFVSGTSQAFTIANPSNKHLILASAQIYGSSATYFTFAQLINTSTSTVYSPVFATRGLVWTSLFHTQVVTFSQASNTIEWQYRTTNAAGTAYISNANFIIIDLGTPV